MGELIIVNNNIFAAGYCLLAESLGMTYGQLAIWFMVIYTVAFLIGFPTLVCWADDSYSNPEGVASIPMYGCAAATIILNVYLIGWALAHFFSDIYPHL